MADALNAGSPIRNCPASHVTPHDVATPERQHRERHFRYRREHAHRDAAAETCSRGTALPALVDEAANKRRLLDDAKEVLTPREVEVVEHLRQGSTNKEIARRLGIMEDTVKKHLQSVFAKLGVHRRALVVMRPIDRPSAVA
jgi:DNA-binding NarL/FixJ family response regulator